MMLALLIYAYADGVRSSRQIERLCRTDVAMRVICGCRSPTTPP
ncbi:transposase [Streptomyces sp. NPDC021218]